MPKFIMLHNYEGKQVLVDMSHAYAISSSWFFDRDMSAIRFVNTEEVIRVTETVEEIKNIIQEATNG